MTEKEGVLHWNAVVQFSSLQLPRDPLTRALSRQASHPSTPVQPLVNSRLFHRSSLTDQVEQECGYLPLPGEGDNRRRLRVWLQPKTRLGEGRD